MSLIYLITALPLLSEKKKITIDKETFFSMAYNSLGKHDLNDINLLLLKERIDFFVRITARLLAENPCLSKNKIIKVFHQKKMLHFTKLGNEVFPSWSYKALSPNQMICFWYKEVFIKAKSLFLKKWIQFSLNLKESIVGLLSKQSSLTKEMFFTQMLYSFDSTSVIMKNKYDDSYLGLKNRFYWIDSLIKAISNDSSELLEKDINIICLKKLNELKPINCFNIDFLMAYYFELDIKLRERSFNKENGEKILNKILISSLEAI